MELEQRGKPPYKILSGGIRENPRAPDQQATAETFLDALRLLFDLSDGGTFGQNTPRPMRIEDAEGQVVFNVRNPKDKAILHQIDTDKEGLPGLKIINKQPQQ